MFVSLGCDKNLVDTENMLGILRNRGFEFTDDEYEANDNSNKHMLFYT